MARQKTRRLNENELTKGHLRKLNALRKSLGAEIADRAFMEWLEKMAKEPPQKADKTAQLIAEAVEALIEKKKLRLPREGYLVKRGRGRVIVTKAEQS